jgi:hypothetical protein
MRWKSGKFFATLLAPIFDGAAFDALEKTAEVIAAAEATLCGGLIDGPAMVEEFFADHVSAHVIDDLFR